MAQRVTVARRGMRGSRGWGHRRHRGRRLERGAKSPARPREAAKDGLDRRAARRPHARAPTPGLRAGPAPEPPGTRALGCRLPPSEEQEKSRRKSRQQGTETSSLPRRECAEGARWAGAALAPGALPRPLRLQSSLPAARVSSTTAARPPTPGCEVGDRPRRPPRSLPARDCGRPLRAAQALACTSQGAVSQLNHRGSFPANKSPAHREQSPSHSPCLRPAGQIR